MQRLKRRSGIGFSGLAAKERRSLNIEHIDRGYERLDEMLDYEKLFVLITVL